MANKFLIFLLIQLVWNCLCAAPAVNFLHIKYFGTKAKLGRALRRAKLRFAPGLLMQLLSLTPPTIDFFKRLPNDLLDDVQKWWGLYVVLLELLGFPILIYIGVGTEKTQGIVRRVRCYSNGNALPFFVIKALQDGYKITHIGLLCWIKMPLPSQAPLRKVLLYALEATFTFCFWAMKSKTKDYGYGKICLWDRKDLTYEGLCSHSALIDPIRGDFDLTHKELLAKNLHQKKRATEIRYQWRVKNEKKALLMKKYYCSTCKQAFATKMALKEHLATQKHAKILDGTWNPEKKKPKPTAEQRIALAEKNANVKVSTPSKKKYERDVKLIRCESCDQTLRGRYAYDKHLETTTHQDNVAGKEKSSKMSKQARTQARNKAEKKFFCEACQYNAPFAKELENHMNTNRHLKKIGKL